MMSSKYSKNLESLLAGLESKPVFIPAESRFEEITIESISSDSRKTAADSLFVAIEGLGNDGHQFVEQAAVQGCAAIICQAGRVTREQAAELGTVVLEVSNTPETYALLAARFFNNPAQKLRCIGITGTNGKTTVSYLLEQVLLSLHLSVGVIGTVNNRYTSKEGVKTIIDTEFTTPEPVLLQSLLVEMVEAGVKYVVMEVSSHALVQARVGAITFEVAVFTNLTRDHLDYHRDMQEYFQAKKLLFSDYLDPEGVAVLPSADIYLSEKERSGEDSLHKLCRSSCKNIFYWGEGKVADIRLLGYSTELKNTQVQIESGGVQYSISSPLVGRFNVDNLLTVFATGSALGLDGNDLCQGLRGANGAPGRLERVITGPGWKSDGPVVLVDYAHTPDALAKVLQTVRELPHNELYCVFGCGGDRDNGKRSVMGKIAATLAHVCIVTDDNPRTESPDQIVTQILGGVEQAGVEINDAKWLLHRNPLETGCTVIRDRKTAIESAIRSASSEDIVVIAGKGHEPYQLTHKGKHYFDDYQQAKEVLCSWTVNLVAEAVSGSTITCNNVSNLLGKVHTDSRLQVKDGVFVALVGDNHDGHDYARQAVENGASCLVVERELNLPDELKVSQILVQDTTKALGNLAAFRRTGLAEISSQVVIGITGSCGKTTVKEMVAAILLRKWPAGEQYPKDCVHKTQGNFNNLIGLPLSLLPLGVQHRAAVLEMGMNRPGELQRLGAISNPDISCITNVHGAHLEGLQSIEGVAKAKEELFQATGSAGRLIVNLDDELVRKMIPDYKQSKITFSVDKLIHEIKPDLWATDIHLDKSGTISFSLHHWDQQVFVILNIAGEHNISNALCAAAISIAAGADLDQIAAGLADFTPPDKRMQLVKGRSGITIINDTYNANPASMSAGLKTLKQMTTRQNAAIIGDMLELGETSSTAHYNIGQLIAQLDLDHVAVSGKFREDVKQGAVEAGLEREKIHTFKEKELAALWMIELLDQKKLGKGDMLLVKASRGLRFETIIDQLGRK